MLHAFCTIPDKALCVSGKHHSVEVNVNLFYFLLMLKLEKKLHSLEQFIVIGTQLTAEC